MWKEPTKSQVPSTSISETCGNTPLPAKTSAHLGSAWQPGLDIVEKASSSLQGQVMLLETWGWRRCGGDSWRERGSCLEALSAIEGDTSEGPWPVGNPHCGRDNPEGLQPRVTQVRGKKQQRKTRKKHSGAERNQYTKHGRQKPAASPKGLGATPSATCLGNQRSCDEAGLGEVFDLS